MTDRLRTKIFCPLALPALFFAAGIVSGRYGPVLTDRQVYLTLTLAFVAAAYLLTRRSKSFLQTLGPALVFLVIGNAHIAAIPPPPLDEPLAILAAANQDAVFSGILRTAPSFNGSKGKFIVDADQLRGDDGATIPIQTRILLKTPFPPAANLAPGARILLRATLAVPSQPGTPGSFDYRRYLADRRIALTGFIRSPVHLSPLRTAPASARRLLLAGHLPQYLRYKTNLFIDGTELPQKLKALYKAIITGQRDSVPLTVLNNFKRSGAIHLLAISGMHLGLLALLTGMALNHTLRQSSWLLLRWPVWKIAAALTLPIMGGYALISGLQPPVVRAFIMAAMFIIAMVFDRQRSLLNGMALAALLILFYDPAALFSVSFQLSFVAVTAIILFNNRFPELFRPEAAPPSFTARLLLWLRSGLAISLVAIFATAPVTLYSFHQLSLMGPLTTILTAPLICFWALPLGLTALLFSPWLPKVAAAVLGLGSAGLSGSDLITATLAAIPGSFQTLPPPSLFAIATYYLLAGYLLLCKSSRPLQAGVAVAMVLILNIPVGSFSPGRNDRQTRITFLDVGQGSATLLELPGNNNILVDGGGSSAPGFDPGEQIIGPFLWRQAIRRLNTLVISHNHQDHYNGLEFIIRNFRPAAVWINGAPEESAGYQNILRAAAEIGARVRVPDKGTVLATFGAAELTCISGLHQRPDPDLPANSRSLVLRLAVGDRKIILPGDILADDGRRLIAQGVDLQSDVLLAPHHGSSNSAGYELVRQGRPAWLIVSASPFKSEYFPNPAFAQWCRQRQTGIINTATSGAVTFTVAESGKLSWQAISGKAAKKGPAGGSRGPVVPTPIIFR